MITSFAGLTALDTKVCTGSNPRSDQTEKSAMVPVAAKTPTKSSTLLTGPFSHESGISANCNDPLIASVRSEATRAEDCDRHRDHPPPPVMKRPHEPHTPPLFVVAASP